MILRFLKSLNVVMLTTNPSLIDSSRLPPLSKEILNDEVGSSELGLITLVKVKLYPPRVYELIVEFGRVNFTYVEFTMHVDKLPSIVHEEFVRVYDDGKNMCIIEFAWRTLVLFMIN